MKFKKIDQSKMVERNEKFENPIKKIFCQIFFGKTLSEKNMRIPESRQRRLADLSRLVGRHLSGVPGVRSTAYDGLEISIKKKKKNPSRRERNSELLILFLPTAMFTTAFQLFK